MNQTMSDREREHREWRKQRIDSTIPASELPVPRLELRWRDERDGPDRYCDYNIVIPLKMYDIRADDPRSFGDELRVRVVWTKSDARGEHPLEHDGLIDTPFRDGSHIAWDAHETKLPAFVVYKDQAQAIEPRPHNKKPGKRYEELEAGPVDDDWARTLILSRARQARVVLEGLALDLKDVKNRQPADSLFRHYLTDCFQSVRAAIESISSPFAPSFGEWLYDQDYTADLKGMKTVCSICGAEIPMDLREACEHILDETSRSILDIVVKAPNLVKQRYELAVVWGPEDRGAWEAGHFFDATSEAEAHTMFEKSVQETGRPYVHLFTYNIQDLEDEEEEEEAE